MTLLYLQLGIFLHQLVLVLVALLLHVLPLLLQPQELVAQVRPLLAVRLPLLPQPLPLLGGYPCKTGSFSDLDATRNLNLTQKPSNAKFIIIGSARGGML